MLSFLTFFALASCVFSGPVLGPLDGRILQGLDTSIEEHPYQVSLTDLYGKHICGGSIIDKDTVLTAAHCFKDFSRPSQLRVRIGSTYIDEGGELVPISAFKLHEDFDYLTQNNDIAVIKLVRPVKESQTVRYIKLATQTPQDRTPAIVTGWGDTRCVLNEICYGSPIILQAVEVKVIAQKQCASRIFKYGSDITDTMFCAADGERDACQGDSGGPLVAGSELIGVVSWGYGCGNPFYPGVYANVAVFHDWIVSTAAAL